MSERKLEGFALWSDSVLELLAIVDCTNMERRHLAFLYSRDLGGKKGIAWPSLELMAVATGASSDSASAKAVAGLAQRGLVRRKRGGGRRNPTVYSLPNPIKLLREIKWETEYSERQKATLNTVEPDRVHKHCSGGQETLSGRTINTVLQSRGTDKEQIKNKKDGRGSLAATASAPEIPKGDLLKLRRKLGLPDTQRGENKAWRIAGDYIKGGGNPDNFDALVNFGMKAGAG